MHTIKLPKRENALPPKQSMHGAAGLKKGQGFPPDMHAQCMLSEERGGFCFLRAFSKNAPKRQIIIFHLASYGKMSQKVLSFYWEGKMVVYFFHY